MENLNGNFGSFLNWLRNSVTLKLFIIGFLALLLLIPAEMIKDTIREREGRSREAIKEVSSTWAEAQQITGPILTIPFQKEIDEQGTVPSVEYLNILPEILNVSGKVLPRELKRNIFSIPVYETTLLFSGHFNIAFLKDTERQYLFDDAFVTIGISDLQGVQENIPLKWNGRELVIEPGIKFPSLSTGINAALDDIYIDDSAIFKFSFNLNLKGSESLSFVPVGNTTSVKLESNWESPKFYGNFLPDTRKVSDEGFSADWNILQINRNLPQTWEGFSLSPDFPSEAFGVEFLKVMDDYQKTFRSVKYALLCIVLTFLIFFVVEIIHNLKIHPFQYLLVGLSLSIFYILLLSISEHIPFNLAYLISAVAIISMISLYSLSVFRRKQSTWLLFISLVLIYAFIFTILQIVQYALLIGSIGLTVAMAATMYFTRNVNWYRLKSA